MKKTNLILLFSSILLLLTVSHESFAQTSQPTLKETVTDSMTTAKIKSQLVVNDNTKASAIKVETKKGIVMLTGIVDSIKEATTAIQIAQSTVGVKTVDTHNLHVKDNVHSDDQTLQDDYITAKIKGLLLKEKLTHDPNFPAQEIKVITENRIVTLRGNVNSQTQLDTTIQLSKSLSKVRQVISKLKIDHDKNQSI